MAGAKNRYFTLVKPRFDTILAWRRRGMTEKEICNNLGISIGTIAIYKNKYPELVDLLKVGKADADAQVENALYKCAVGFQYEEKEVVTEGDSVRVKITNKMYVPNVTAQMAYLQNRCFDRWRDKRIHEISGINGEPIKTIDESKHGDNIVNIIQNDPKAIRGIIENALAGVDSHLQSNRGPFSPFSPSSVHSSE